MRKCLRTFCFFLFITNIYSSVLGQQQFQEYKAGLPPQVQGEAFPGGTAPVATTPTAPDPTALGVPLPAPTSVSTVPVSEATPTAMPTPGTPGFTSVPGTEVPAAMPDQIGAFGTAQIPGQASDPQMMPDQAMVPSMQQVQDTTGFAGQVPGQVPGAQMMQDQTMVPATQQVQDTTGLMQQVPGQVSGAQMMQDQTMVPATQQVPAQIYPQTYVPTQAVPGQVAPAPVAVPTIPVAPQAIPTLDTGDYDEPTAQAAVPSELKGIDTLDIDEAGGNWLIKRMWYEKAEDKMEKIEDAVDEIMDSRSVFFEKRDKTDSDLFDPFYREVGIDQGKLEEIIGFLMEQLKQRREKQVTLSQQEREFVKKLEAQKDILKQLEANIDGISKIDDSVDDAITQLLEQINRARGYKKEARVHLKKIGDVLDHNKARELYAKIESEWQSIKVIKEYIDTKFTSHFDEILSIAKKQTTEIKEDLDVLEQKGVSFKQQMKKFEQQADDQEILEQQAEQEEELLETEQKGWIETIVSYVVKPFQALWNWISSFWSPDDVQQEEVFEAEVEEQIEMPTPKEIPTLVEEPASKPIVIPEILSAKPSNPEEAFPEPPEASETPPGSRGNSLPVPAPAK